MAKVQKNLTISVVLLCLYAANFVTANGPSTRYLPPTNVRYPSNQYYAQSSDHLRYPSPHGAAGPVALVRGKYVQPGSVYHGGGSGAYNQAAAQIPILKQDYSNDGSGNYNFDFDTANGIHRDEAGQFQGSSPDGSLNVMGSYSYTGDDGRTYTVHYRADENGFHAEGDHLPTPPPDPAFAGTSNYIRGISTASTAYSPSTRYLPPQSHYKKYY